MIQRFFQLCILGVMALAFCPVSSAQVEKEEETFVLTPVVRVFMHQSGVYSFLYTRPGDKRNELYASGTVGCGLRDTIPGLEAWLDKMNSGILSPPHSLQYHVIADVPNGEPMYMIVRHLSPVQYFAVELHIHSAADIGGGGYVQSKYPVQTNVVE